MAVWFPKRERALATTLFTPGANVDALAAPAVVPALAFKFGWQAPFVVMGCVGLAWPLLWLPLEPIELSRPRP